MDEKKCILLIEDTGSLRWVYNFDLRSQGYETLSAASGEMGFKLAKTHKPDLILLDVALPGMDGFETCRKLKANPDTKEIPVIFITAKSNPNDVIQGMTAGGAYYLIKPFKFEEMLEKIQEILGKP